MKKQKGFTLIELLAVIVILAIIALIATPMIMDVIDKAKKGAAEASANGYVEAIEKYSLIDMIDNADEPGIPTNRVYDLSKEEDKTVLDNAEVKGEKPESGWVYVNDKGMVEAADLKFKSHSKSIGYVIGSTGKATKNDKTTTVPTAENAKKTVEDAINGTTTTPSTDDNA